MTYIMSDIHGNLRRFNSIMKQINLRADDVLYVLGDVIDRYPDGVRILKKIMKMPNVKMLLGNHEYMMLRAIGHPYDADDHLDCTEIEAAMNLWYRNNGGVTHNYWKHIRKNVREEVITYLQSLPLNYDVEVNGTHYRLVHGAPTEEYKRFIYRYDNATHFSVWKRWRFFEKQHGDYIMIFGHTPTMDYQDCVPMQIWYGENRIGIDCGSGFPEDVGDYYAKYGRLACLRLDDMKEFYSEEGHYPEGE